MPKLLGLTRFGNPILRTPAKRVAIKDIKTVRIQELISNIRYTNKTKKYGVGLAAPQVGESLALSVIGIKPTPARPELNAFDCVIINPTYSGIGELEDKWEGCQSGGSGDDIMFGQTQRFASIHATWYDENGTHHKKDLDGLIAHVFQHETDHLNGILFVDKVADSSSYMMADEYRKRILGIDDVVEDTAAPL